MQSLLSLCMGISDEIEVATLVTDENDYVRVKRRLKNDRI